MNDQGYDQQTNWIERNHGEWHGKILPAASHKISGRQFNVLALFQPIKDKLKYLLQSVTVNAIRYAGRQSKYIQSATQINPKLIKNCATNNFWSKKTGVRH